MRISVATLALSMLLIVSCKTTSPDKGKLRSDPEQTQAPLQGKPFNAQAVCDSLKNDSFQWGAVIAQIQWLCDRNGFAILKQKAFIGKGTLQPVEYFAEQDKIMYYAVGMSLDGSLANLTGLNDLFCDNFESLRAKFSGQGLEDVQSITVSKREEASCEYLQTAVPQWGVRADFKAAANFGKLEEHNMNWRVDGMIAPLNYSPIKQYSVLALSWEEEGRLQGVYLIRVQVQVSGLLMGTARSAMKKTITNMMKGYQNLLQ